MRTNLVVVPRWPVVAAHAAALVALPSGLWRIGLVLGFPLGYTEEGLRALLGTGAAGPAYLVALSVLTEGAGLLTLGLVRPWGEVVPRWVPYAGGRVIPRRAVLAAAWAGVVVLAVLWTPFLFWWAVPHGDMTATEHLLVGFVYLPLVAWAPLLAAVTLAYQRRTR
ncbi:hypothetical protein [Nonomuraea ceibae]|uniref:hypothetical protein n=1 Tax=Nonomuraea ceibae TaxID=1935170 RepID=UPI001FE41904|nr:hypothetical protein [Nonomuraea ceibae]